MSYPNERPLPEFNQISDLSQCIGATIERAWSTDDQIAIRFTDGRVFFAVADEPRYSQDSHYIELLGMPGDAERVLLGVLSQGELEERKAAQADWDRRCREGREREEYLKLKAKFEAGTT